MNYSPGQIWRYRTRAGEEHTRILILKSENNGSGNVVHLTVVGTDFEAPEHMPFSEQAVDASVVSLESDQRPLPDFKTGYEIWREESLKGRAGVYSITVAEALDL